MEWRKKRHKNQQNNQLKNASHQELINVNSRSRLRAHVPGYPCSILQCRIYIPSSHECKWQPWRINRFWPNKSRRERMFIRCKITQNLNTMLFVKFCCVWQKPGIPTSSVSNINSTPRNSRNVENLRKLISSHMSQRNSSVTFHNLPRSQGILVKCLITAILLLYNILLNDQYNPLYVFALASWSTNIYVNPQPNTIRSDSLTKWWKNGDFKEKALQEAASMFP